MLRVIDVCRLQANSLGSCVTTGIFEWQIKLHQAYLKNLFVHARPVVYKHSNHVMNIDEIVRSATQSIKHYTAMNFTC